MSHKIFLLILSMILLGCTNSDHIKTEVEPTHGSAVTLAPLQVAIENTRTPTVTVTPSETASAIPSATVTLTPTIMPPGVTLTTSNALDCALIPQANIGVLPTPIYHTVETGQSLSEIAAIYGKNINDLMQINHIQNASLLAPNQLLSIVPAANVPPLPAPLPAPLTGMNARPYPLFEGETACLTFSTSQPTTLYGTFIDQPIHVISNALHSQHLLLLGVPIYTRTGLYPLKLTLFTSLTESVQFRVDLPVQAGSYITQAITLSGDKISLLDPGLEQNEINLLTSHASGFTTPLYMSGGMQAPVQGTVNSSFGERRTYNQQDLPRYHNGVDYFASTGTPIVAPAAGKVVFMQVLDIRGITTMLDHGGGIYTVYAHQAEQFVKIGDEVTAGQVIGTVGETGRATGTHLHWEVWVNGISVNPIQWMQP